MTGSADYETLPPGNFGLGTSLGPFVYFALGGALKAFSIAFVARKSHIALRKTRLFWSGHRPDAQSISTRLDERTG
jgi:hypothetical protein